MGKKGFKSKRGIGEKDFEVRQTRISVWATKSDAEKLDLYAKAHSLSKADVVIFLIRNFLDND
ncbi:hypothetical protein [Aerosakkonema sp. BLCC-F183]|uniref:hypothetical protein n=1 Tax=Aerosakkonema sp. BLCC-F183 TaxID=3342834 RepID=UPI0035BC58F5